LAGNDLAAYEKALALKPGIAEARLGCGNVFVDQKRYDKAFPAFDRALELKTDLSSVGLRLHAKMNICEWSNLDAECAHLISSVRNGHENTSPFPFLTIPSSSDDQLQCAKLWVALKISRRQCTDLARGEIQSRSNPRCVPLGRFSSARDVVSYCRHV
jgi:tetratricopeptide (TPR) repeat protein